MAKKKNWIAAAVAKNPGALKKKAKKAGALTADENIQQGWLEEKAKAAGTLGKEARLALTLKKMRKGKKK
jgi:hypothetical protein